MGVLMRRSKEQPTWGKYRGRAVRFLLMRITGVLTLLLNRPSLLLAICSWLLVPFALLPFSQSQKTPVPDAWPQFRGNPALTGAAPGTVPERLKVAWTLEAGEPIESSAAIADGTVYVGSQGGELLAVDLKTGALRWKYKTNEAIGESSPCVANGIVYVGDLSGLVHAVNAQTGQGLWTFRTGSEIKASPVVVGDKVLIGSYDETLYCLAARTGAEVWKFRINGPVHCTVSVAAGIAYVSGCDEIFRAVRIARWQRSVSGLFWRLHGCLAGAEGAVAFFGTFSNEVLSVNLRSKEVLWRYENKERQFPFYSSVALSEGKVVLGGRDKLVHCLDAGTGKPVWTFVTRARIDSSPAIANGRVYIGSNDGRFYVLDLRTGANLWEFEAGAPLSASPAIANGRIVIGSQDGRLYCFG